MKKVTGFILVAFVLSFVMPNLILADTRDDDFQAIKKAVKENPSYEAGKEVKWFKVLITDNVTKEDKVKITIPISVIELILKSEHKHPKMHLDECDVDIGELFKELKKLGPMVFIEINDDGETIKVWFE
ncbi:MAG: hypothetical protein ISS41_05095 [Candidatus Aminicenantes bacterium]|nr:hypothetical protein [Candidatus Aminicenantes bacterium]